MTDPQMPQDKSFEDREQPIDFDDFKIQNIEWGNPVKHSNKERGGFDEISEASGQIVFKDVTLLLDCKKTYHKSPYENLSYVSYTIKVVSAEGQGDLALSINVYENSTITTNIKKTDPDHNLPKEVGKFIYHKLNSFFRYLADNDEEAFHRYPGGHTRDSFHHEVHRDESYSDKESFDKEKWYKVFGSYFTKHRCSYLAFGEEWTKYYQKIPYFSDIEFLDFDWEDEPAYDGDEKDVRIKPSKMHQVVEVDENAVLEGRSLKYYKISAEDIKLQKKTIDFQLTQGDQSITIKMLILDGQVTVSIEHGNSENQLDEEISRDFADKIEHYLMYKAIEDGNDYEYEGKVYNADAEDKLVEEFLKNKGVDFDADTYEF